MADEEAREFYRKLELPKESICLSCFRTVRADRSERLEDAEDAHRYKCPNGMKIPELLHNPNHIRLKC